MLSVIKDIAIFNRREQVRKYYPNKSGGNVYCICICNNLGQLCHESVIFSVYLSLSQPITHEMQTDCPVMPGSF